MPAVLFSLLFPLYLLLCGHVLIAAVLTQSNNITYTLAAFSSLEVILQDNQPNWLRPAIILAFSLLQSHQKDKGREQNE